VGVLLAHAKALLVEHLVTLLQGTWTPLHADVLRSYSWSTNLTGRKRWKLLPPQFTHLLYDRFGRYTAVSLFHLLQWPSVAN